MTEMRQRYAGHHECHFPCSCGDWHFLNVSIDEVDKDWRFLEIADTYWPGRLRDRVRVAVTVLRKKPHYTTGVLLDEGNTRDLKEVIDGLVSMYDKEKES